ncbi:hypothetical protein [Streptomyces luteireticuli]|uniref:hypothetical protein n=1 Tax=Streptomyces luteireticuli TaxID=173858 RepID=UPI0035578BFC
MRRPQQPVTAQHHAPLRTAPRRWGAAVPATDPLEEQLAALQRALSSIFALRGLSLRPVINNPALAALRVNIYPAFHFPPQPMHDHDDLDDGPDNVYPLGR